MEIIGTNLRLPSTHIPIAMPRNQGDLLGRVALLEQARDSFVSQIVEFEIVDAESMAGAWNIVLIVPSVTGKILSPCSGWGSKKVPSTLPLNRWPGMVLHGTT